MVKLPVTGHPGIGSRLPSRKLQSEINQPLFAQINFAEISAWHDFANLIADPMRQQRRLRVIEDDALLLVHPARTLVDLRDDRVQSEGQNFVSQHAFAGIKNFSLPRKMVYEIRDV